MHKTVSRSSDLSRPCLRVRHAVIRSSVRDVVESRQAAVLMRHGAPPHVCTLTQSCQ
jgi:hypothetical protein